MSEWKKGHPKEPSGDYIVTNDGLGKIRMGMAYWGGKEWMHNDDELESYEVEYWLDIPPHPKKEK